jgi:HEAT repeat protein
VTLAQHRANAIEAVPALAEALDDADASVRWNAILALESIGTKALPAAPALSELMHRDSTPAAIYAARALVVIDPQAKVVPRLIELLDADDVDTRRQAVNRLQHIGPANANAAVPKLMELLDDSNVFVRSAAIEAMTVLASPEESIPALKRVLESDPNAGIRCAAAHALIQIDARATIPGE